MRLESANITTPLYLPASRIYLNFKLHSSRALNKTYLIYHRTVYVARFVYRTIAASQVLALSTLHTNLSLVI